MNQGGSPGDRGNACIRSEKDPTCRNERKEENGKEG
jgi:hypothetical protein